METAIILIAFVVVASVFAFAVLSTGLFTSDKAKETIQAGLSRARSNVETKGGIRISATNTAAVGATAVTSTGAALAAAATTGFLPHKPLLSGTATVRYAGVVQTAGATYTIDHEAGQLTFTPALVAANLPVTSDYTWYKINSVTIPVGLSAGGEGVDLSGGVTVISYTDVDTAVSLTDYTLTKLGNADADNVLEPGELFEITVVICKDNTTVPDGECLDQTVATQHGVAQTPADLNYGLASYDTFRISVKPGIGSVVLIERTIPSNITPVMDLG
jgi:archaellin